MAGALQYLSFRDGIDWVSRDFVQSLRGRRDTTEAYGRAANKFVVLVPALPLSTFQPSRICGSALKEQRICV